MNPSCVSPTFQSARPGIPAAVSPTFQSASPNARSADKNVSVTSSASHKSASPKARSADRNVSVTFQASQQLASPNSPHAPKNVSATAKIIAFAILLITALTATASDRPTALTASSPSDRPTASSPSDRPTASSPSDRLTAPPAPDDKHRLAIGDRLSFRILEDQEDPTEPREPKSLTVSDTGELEIPYIGRFPAENKTCKQLATELKAALEREYYHQATVLIAVDLMAKSRGKVYLVGPVRIPGPQEIPSDEVLTLGKAIMRAGGFTDFADRRGVKVTRKGSAGESDKKTFVVDVGDIFDKGKVERDLPLEPGDLILIPERAIRF